MSKNKLHCCNVFCNLLHSWDQTTACSQAKTMITAVPSIKTKSKSSSYTELLGSKILFNLFLVYLDWIQLSYCSLSTERTFFFREVRSSGWEYNTKRIVLGDDDWSLINLSGDSGDYFHSKCRNDSNFHTQKTVFFRTSLTWTIRLDDWMFRGWNTINDLCRAAAKKISK